MTITRFNQLMNGPLYHPLPGFTITRLQLALLHVIQSTGEAGDKALEDWCEHRQNRDIGYIKPTGEEDGNGMDH